MSARHAPGNRRPTIWLLFALMAAVFAFGLNARIQMFRTGASITYAKLSLNKISPEEVVTATAEMDPPEPLAHLHLLLNVVAVPVLPSQDALRSLQIDWSLLRASSLDEHGPSLMLRPPPYQL